MKRIPCATYRLQFNREFTFKQAGEILDYLNDLGVSDVYASPLFQAGPESTHGYDTCSFGKLNLNLGSADDFEQLTGGLKQRGMGLVLDLVPNHMSATLSNPWWLEVLEQGREAPHARFFDINWRPNNSALHDKVLLPVLEDHYAKVLASGKLRLTFQNGKFGIAYHDRVFPVNRASLPRDGKDDPNRVLKEFNGTVGDAGSFDRLDELIQHQHYRIAYWKVASEEINYRRFFDVTEMVAVKMELPEVFSATHELVFDWLKSGKVTGLRIDHPDGLWDPKEYLERLQRDEPRYVVVEKILSGDEQLPKDWQTDGTTGYDFLNRTNGLFVNEGNASAFDEIYRDFTGNKISFHEIVYTCRQQVLKRSFASELQALTHRLHDLAARMRSGRDFTFPQLHTAAAEVTANFPVYRTYVTETSAKVSGQDRGVVEEALKSARERSESDSAAIEFIGRLLLLEMGDELDERGAKLAREFVMKFQQLTGPAMAKGLEDTAFYRFNRLISLNEVGGEPGKFGGSVAEFHEANIAMAKQWPHTMLASATHDTKRGEDLRARLNVLSEMPADWRNAASHWSQMNRGKKTSVENSPAPDANDEYLLYQTMVGAWPADGNSNEGLKSFRTRVAAFMLKAAKEAKVHTNWTESNAAYEKALRDFAERVLSSEGNGSFIGEVQRFAKRVAFFGRLNSLAQTLLKITSPGIPDFYQGNELWDLNLVDPDNRRPIDYAGRKKLLSELKKASEGGEKFFAEILKEDEIGKSKLFLIWRALNFRKSHRELFDSGDYNPLSANGPKQEHLCAFARTHEDQAAIVVVPRLVLGVTQGAERLPVGDDIWGKTILTLPAKVGTSFRNVLTGETVVVPEGKGALELANVLKNFSVALLEKI